MRRQDSATVADVVAGPDAELSIKRAALAIFCCAALLAPAGAATADPTSAQCDHHRSGAGRKACGQAGQYRDPDRGEGTEVTSTVVGVFRSGLKRVDEGQIYSLLGFAQVMMGRSGIINELRLRLDDPLIAQKVATQVEALTGYKSVSWREANSDLCRASRFAISSC
jgi:hypothetical protein